MPLISLIFTKLFITENIMNFLSTLVLFIGGRYYTSINENKYEMWKMIILKSLVPPMALQHYEALIMYIQYAKDY